MPKSPYVVESVDSDILEEKLAWLHNHDRRVISIIPEEFWGGDFDYQYLAKVKIVHVAIESYVT